MDTFAAVGRRGGLYCGLQDIGPLRLASYALGRGIDPAKRQTGQFVDRNILFTHQGRGAIAALCRVLGLGRENEVLMPAYNCGTEVDPFLQCGAKVVLYRVDSEAGIDADDIRRRATSRTRVLYVTHYFGWPQNLEDLVEWSRSRGIALVEDCALSLFSSSAERPLGTSGDAAIFAFPKTLPMPDGGALTCVKGLGGVALKLRPPSSKAVFRETLPLLKRGFLRALERIGAYPLVMEKAANSWRRKAAPIAARSSPHPDIPDSYYFDRGTAEWAASRIAMRVLKNADARAIVEKRRENYLRLSDALSELSHGRPLFRSLGPGVCPLAFPLVVENRSRLVAELNARGIAAIAWWSGYHRDLDWEEFPEASHLKDHLVTLPIHQGLGKRHIEYIGACVMDLGSAG